MNTKLVAIALGVLMLLTACGTPEQVKQPEQVQVQETTQVETTTTVPNGDVTEIESTNAEVDKLNEELDTSQFDQLDKELAQLDNLELD